AGEQRHAHRCSSRLAVVDSRLHLTQQLIVVVRHPTVTLARTVNDRAIVRRFSLRKKAIQQMNRVVQKVVVSFADPDVKLPSQLWSERLPVLFEDQPEIVFLPMLYDAVIDLAGLRVPQWNGTSVAALWPVDRIPRSPLFAGHRPTVAATHHV